MPRKVISGEYPKHRHHGPHRRRQDHHHRAYPVLHRRQLQDRRDPRRHRHHGLDGPGAGARHHHHLRRHHLLLEGDQEPVPPDPDQHHRHPGPRGLHRGGGALPARAGRLCDRHVRQGRRGAPVRDCVAPGGPLQGPPHDLRQQDGHHGRRLLQRAAT